MLLLARLGARRLARTLVVLVAAAGAMATSVAPAEAGVFLGVLSAGKPAAPPFVFSPNSMTLGSSGATVTFTISVKNLTSEPQAVTLNFNVHHILTYYGLNVADGQPGQPGITFAKGDAPNTTQQLVGTPQLVTMTFPPAAEGPTTVTFQQDVDTAGYFQVDVGQHQGINKSHANLSAGFTRVLNHELAQPSIRTAPTPTSARVGTTLKDRATLSGGQSPSGTITFTLYDQKNVVAHTETLNVTAGNATYSTSTGHRAGAAGTWHWKAAYNGDANNSPIVSAAAGVPVVAAARPPVHTQPSIPAKPVPVVVAAQHVRAHPSIGTTPNPTSASVGVTLQDSAALSGGHSPTGTITFTLYDPSDVVAHMETVNVTSGNGTYSTSTGHFADAVGTWHWKAVYSGDANNLAVASNPAEGSVILIPSGGAGGLGRIIGSPESSPTDWSVALFVAAFGALALMAAIAWRRRQVNGRQSA